MRIKISVGQNAYDRNLQTKEVSLPELIAMFSQSTDCGVSSEQWATMSADDKMPYKNKKIFVGGVVEGRRTLNRRLITLDFDNAKAIPYCPFWHIVYSSISHTPAKPKFRLIILSDTDIIDANQYKHIVDSLALTFTEPLDESSNEFNRVMFMPMHLSDVEPIFINNTHLPLFKVPEYSPMIPNKVERNLPRHITKFNEENSIHDLLSTLGAEDYVRASDDRYTYLKGSTSGGVVIYEDSLMYSNHSTDPLAHRLIDCYDLFKHYTFFGDENKMKEYLRGGEPEFQVSQKTGELLKNAFNMRLAARHIAQNRLRYNEFADMIEVDGNLITDAVLNGLHLQVVDKYGLCNKQLAIDVFEELALENSYHPVREYLNKLEWDGTPRLAGALHRHLGCPDTPYHREVLRLFMLGAIQRIFVTGSKFDFTLILTGEQGVGKSTFVKRLSNDFVNENIRSFSGRESYEALKGSWFVEIGELAAFNKSAIEEVKQFLSKTSDKYRSAYGRVIQDHKRTCVFIATTNEDMFLNDSTGARRFLPVKVSQSLSPTWGIEFNVDQLWAEAMKEWRLHGGYAKLSQEALKELDDTKLEVTIEDPLMEEIQGYLNQPKPLLWHTLSKETQRLFYLGQHSVVTDLVEQTVVCVNEIGFNLDCKKGNHLTVAESNRIRKCLTLLGWKLDARASSLGVYGKIRVYRK